MPKSKDVVSDPQKREAADVWVDSETAPSDSLGEELMDLAWAVAKIPCHDIHGLQFKACRDYEIPAESGGLFR